MGSETKKEKKDRENPARSYNTAKSKQTPANFDKYFSQTPSSQKRQADSEFDRMSAISELKRRRSATTNNLSIMNLTEQINRLEQAGLEDDGFTRDTVPIRDDSGMTVGVYGGGLIKTYSGRPLNNPLRRNRRERQSMTRTATSSQPVISTPESNMPSAVRRRINQSTAGNDALRRRFLGR